MKSEHHSEEPERESVDEFASQFTGLLRRGDQPSPDELAERFPGLSTEMTGLAKTLSVLEEASFRRQAIAPFGAVVDSSGKRMQSLGGFRLIREISRGGMGIVYEAEQESLRRRVAIKVLPPSPLLTDTERARFSRESTAVARLHHAHIVQVFGTGREQGVQYTVMQYIEGYSLDRLIEAVRRQIGDVAASDSAATSQRDFSGDSEVNGFPVFAAVDVLLNQQPSDVREHHQPVARSSKLSKSYFQNVARIGADVADALCHSHQQGVLHRDIKPANILLDRSGQVWVTDFGLARIDDDRGLTGSGDLVGTLRFTPPEQFQGLSDERSDVYSLGMTLYELCTLERTYTANDRWELMRKVLNESPVPPRLLNPSIPRDLETIILKSISRERENRYQSASEQLADLRNFIDDRPVNARRLKVWERSWRWCRRNRLDASLIGFATMMLLFFSASTTIAYIREARLHREAEETATFTRASLDRIYDFYLPDWTTSSTVTAHGSINVSSASAQMLEELIEIYEGIATQRKGSEKEHTLQSTAAMRRVGVMYRRLGQFEKSRTAYEKAKHRLQTYNHGLADPEVQLELAAVLNEIGVVAYSERNFTLAYHYHRQAIEILDQIPGVPDNQSESQSETHNRPQTLYLFEIARALYLAGRRPSGLDGGVVEYERISQELEPTGVSNDDRHSLIQLAIKVLNEIVDRDPGHHPSQHLLALAYREQSDGYVSSDGEPDQETAQAIERLQKLVGMNPDHPAYLYSLCRTLQWLKLENDATVDVANLAVDRYHRSIRIAEQLMEQHPDEWIYVTAKVAGHYHMARALRIAGRMDEGLASGDVAIEYAEQLSADHPDSDLFRYLVGSTYRKRGDMLRGNNEPELALAAYDKAATELSKLLGHPLKWEVIVQRTLHRVAKHQSELLAAFGKQKESRQAEKRANEFRDRWRSLLPNSN